MRTKCSRLGVAAIVLFLMGVVPATAIASPTKKSLVHSLVVAAPVGFVDSDEKKDAKPANATSPLPPLPAELVVGPTPELVDVTPVPEPSGTVVLLIVGSVAAARRSRRK